MTEEGLPIGRDNRGQPTDDFTVLYPQGASPSSFGSFEQLHMSKDSVSGSFHFLGEKEHNTDDTNVISSDRISVSRTKDQSQGLQNSVVDENTGIELRDLKPSPPLEPHSGGPSPSWGSPLNGLSMSNGSPSWSSWLGDGYVSVKSYVLNCFYSWMPSPSELPSFSNSEIHMIKGKTFTPEEGAENGIAFTKFIVAFHSLFWFTYRRDFEAIMGSLTSDTGWGCMLRSGQMMLSQVLVTHFLGKDWELDKDEQMDKYYEILSWFTDRPDSLYSVHRITQGGVKYGKNVGEWLGPSTITLVLSDLVKNNLATELVIHTTSDSTLYLDEITRVCTKRGGWSPLFILIPLRLGIDSVNSVYNEALCRIFQIPQCMGFVGGRPRAAMYFVASQDDNLFYLDPHTSQPTVVTAELNGKVTGETYHRGIPLKMNVSGLDPSLSIGFYCTDRKDFDEFWMYAKEMRRDDSPVFGVEDESPDYMKNSEENMGEDVIIL